MFTLRSWFVLQKKKNLIPAWVNKKDPLGEGGSVYIYGYLTQFFCNNFRNGLYYPRNITMKGNNMSNGPTHSNRNFKVMKTITLQEGEYIVEEWNGSNWNDSTKSRDLVPGAKDIKVYNKIDDPDRYNKGEVVAFFRVFENKPRTETGTYSKPEVKEDSFDDEIPF